MISIKVPPLGESIVEATISRWLKREGDAVSVGETLVELETDKVTVEVPATKAGVLVRRLKQDGDVVRVDEPLATLDETAAIAPVHETVAPPPPAPNAADFAPWIPGTPATPELSPAPRPTPPVSVPPAAPRPVVAMPVTPAQPVAPLPPVAAPSPVPRADLRSSPAARRLAEELHIDLGAITGTGRGGVVSKPDVIEQTGASQPALLGGRGAEAAPEREEAGVASPVLPAPPPTASPPPPPPPAPPATAAPASPLPEVSPRPEPQPLRVPSAEAPLPAMAGSSVRESREKMSTRRRRISEHLLEAQHATAHLTTFNEIDMSALEALRGRIKERIERDHGVRLSFMPFFVRAACRALAEFPTVNARIDGDDIVYHHYVNMGVAVASEDGLVVPAVKDVDRKGLLQVARDIVELARKARDGKLTMDDLTGGTFTITNGGIFGSLLSTPIINFPQVAILGLHKIQERPVVVEGRIEARPMMYVALSYDHRLIDGQQAVRFLVRVRELLEDPAMMVVD